jgi:penicillin-binding protein 2
MALFNQSRSFIIRLIFGAVFFIIVLQLFNLQIISGKYRQLAMINAVFPKVKYPDRGIIYDRKGRAILNNTIMYDLVVTPAEVKKIDTISLCQLLEIDTAEFKKRMLDARLKNGPFRPSIFEDLLPPALHARLDENIWKYPGFALVERPVRVYPFNAAAHIMGYIGEADSAIIKRSQGFYRLGDYVGRNGLEAYYENVLMGQRGVQYMIKDNKNRLVGSYENGAFDTAAIAGRNLRTYIDIEVQQLAEKLMTNKVGAVVAIEPKTGGIIAMVSAPNYNPNDLTGPDKQKNFSRMLLDVKGPTLNRAIQGNYEPGSTFKPLGALVALDEGVISANFGYPCSGRYFACGHGKPACTHNNAGHAANLRLSIANSCNSYYAHIYRLSVDNPKYGGVKKGYARWRDYLFAFGLGTKTGVDLPSEGAGLIPDTGVYNRVYRGAWNSCTNLTLGIGQDMMQATPLQLANAMCIIANKGYYYTPHFVKSIDGESPDDTLLKKFKTKHAPLTQIPDEAYEDVISGMQDVVERGTARAAMIPGINIAAKTGTAEKFRIIDKRKIQLKDNSMFVCFAPREDPKIAIAVVVENSGFGSTWAAPIASLMIEKYLNDTLRAERLKEVERIASASLLPDYFDRLQFIEDSTRAERWREMTGDSSRLKKFLRRGYTAPPQPAKKPEPQVPIKQLGMLAPDKKLFANQNQSKPAR